jgi:hypothetical protein
MNHDKTLGAAVEIVETEALRIEAISNANRRQ